VCSSDLGCLLVDIRHDLAQSYLKTAKEAEPGDIETNFQQLEADALARLKKEGVKPGDIILQRSIDMMYQGQWRSLQVSVGSPFTSIEAAIDSFHINHEREYAYRRDDAPVDLFRLNLTAVGVTQKAELAKHRPSGGTMKAHGTRPVSFDEADAPIETPIYLHEDLPSGVSFQGPAIIEQLDSTTVVPPGVRAEVDEWMNIRMYIAEDSK